MRYEQTGEDEVDLETQFSVTHGDGEVMLELFGGSLYGEYYMMTLEEAKNLHSSLGDIIKMQAAEARAKSVPALLNDLLERVQARNQEAVDGR